MKTLQRAVSLLLLSSALLAVRCNAVTHEVSGVDHGRIESPGYPEPYENNEEVIWTITVEENYKIELFFTVFDLEDSYDEDLGGSCVYDFVQIDTDPTDSATVSTREYCGNQHISFPGLCPRPGQKITSKGNVMKVRFVTDYSNEDPLPVGFQGFWKKVDRDECKEMRAAQFGEDWDEQLYCNHHCINTPGSYFCSCRPGFVLDENKHTCKAVCSNIVLNDDSGRIETSEFPHSYSKLAQCDWTIQVRDGLSINLVFDPVFDIEEHPDEECPYDALKVSYDGQEQVFCGQTAPNNGEVISTNTRTVKLTFTSDLAVEGRGFQMNYFTSRIQCPNRPEAPEDGSIASDAIDKSAYEFEDVVSFSCNAGFDLIGEDTLTCLSDGSWDHTPPTCKIKSCGSPTALETAPHTVLDDMTGVAFTYGDVLKISCVEWYQMDSGCQNWVCDENGQWSPVTPTGDDGIPVCSPECGIKNGDGAMEVLTVHLANSPEASPNEWPWIVFLNFGLNPKLHANTHTCMGFVVSPEYIATAAHCMYSEDGGVYTKLVPQNIGAWLGAHDRRYTIGGVQPPVKQVNVLEVITHPDYTLPIDVVGTDEAQWNNDYALLRVAEPIKMNYFIRPVCIPETESEMALFKEGDDSTPEGVVAGWGYTTAAGQTAYTLHEARLPSITNDQCYNSLVELYRNSKKALSPNIKITNNMFCAGYMDGQSSATCQGDSGSPYVVNDSSNKYYAFGIVSFGAGTCTLSWYSSFAKMTPAASKWMRDTAGL